MGIITAALAPRAKHNNAVWSRGGALIDAPSSYLSCSLLFTPNTVHLLVYTAKKKSLCETKEFFFFFLFSFGNKTLFKALENFFFFFKKEFFLLENSKFVVSAAPGSRSKIITFHCVCVHRHTRFFSLNFLAHGGLSGVYDLLRWAARRYGVWEGPQRARTIGIIVLFVSFKAPTKENRKTALWILNKISNSAHFRLLKKKSSFNLIFVSKEFFALFFNSEKKKL